MFTARKCSFGEGNVFRSVRQSFCSQGGGGVTMSLPFIDSTSIRYGEERAVRILLECFLVFKIFERLFAVKMVKIVFTNLNGMCRQLLWPWEGDACSKEATALLTTGEGSEYENEIRAWERDPSSRTRSEHENEIRVWERDPSMRMRSGFENEIRAWEWDPGLRTRSEHENEIWVWEWDPSMRMRSEFENEIWAWEWDPSSRMRSEHENEIRVWEQDPSMRMRSGFENEIRAWERDPSSRTRSEHENEIWVQERDPSTRTRSQFENKLNENKVQFARIRDKNVNFVLCQFQRFVLYLQKLFWVSILKST